MKALSLIRLSILALLSLTILASCGWTGRDTADAMKVFVLREGVARGVNDALAAPRDPGSARVSPTKARIAFTKIWYPTKETLVAIYADSANKRMEDFTSIADPASCQNGCLRVLERPDTDPFVFDLDNPDAWWDSEVFPLVDTIYPGVIVEAQYYEFEFSDFVIRWYTRDEGTEATDYQRGDVLVKTEATVTGGTNGDWLFAYLSEGDGAIRFFTERQVTGSGYQGLTQDMMWDKWADPLDQSGLLPGTLHSIFHNPIDSIDEHSSMYFASGFMPETVEYHISYNLSTEYGGLEYDASVDANTDGQISFSDLSAAGSARPAFNMVPITGAIEYNAE